MAKRKTRPARILKARKARPLKTEPDVPVRRDTAAGFPIVGIGASAGGFEALELFFRNVPPASGMAFVVIQHLDPHHVGVMPELLQRATSMKVRQATDRLAVRPNNVYVIPPHNNLSILNGVLHLFDTGDTRQLRLPIDTFFRSLAAEGRDRSIAIVLSGMGSDGSLGVKAIKETNGVVLVQDPVTAKFDSMPRNALQSVTPDIVAAPEDLPGRLVAFLQYHPVVTPDDEVEGKEMGSLEKIILLLRERSGHDFSLYKKSTLIRRINRRKVVHKVEGIQQYVRFLQENPQEITILFKELLIGVTSFFRDRAVWEELRERILPGLVHELPDGHVLRAWVPGCSTGEEAYSLAMVLEEVLEDIKGLKRVSVQIFATDLDADAIQLARRGEYPKNIAPDVPGKRLSRFFAEEENSYRVVDRMRETVVFATQNVIKDPPFTRLDILSSRNMLIYMEPPLQKSLMALFNYSLSPGGIMILGASESPGDPGRGFEVLDSRLKIYKRTHAPRPQDLFEIPGAFRHVTHEPMEKTFSAHPDDNLQQMADRMVLERIGPAGVLVNEAGDVLYVTGKTERFLAATAGKANWNIHVMAREGLREALPAALRKAMRHKDAVVLRNVRVGEGTRKQTIDVTVQRIDAPVAMRGMMMIILTDAPSAERGGPRMKVAKPATLSQRQKQLENEVKRAYEELRVTREEMQTSQEELQSTNEELQSTNEELQSTNEELTTSKEEMQSMNEEMQSINTELQSKVNDALETGSDLANLLNATEIATLFLDKQLNVRRFTDATTRIIKLRSTDVGRPFTDLVSDLHYPAIESDAWQVLRSLRTAESTVKASDGRWFTIRIMPYRTLDDRIDGLVMTFADITRAKDVESALKEASDVIVASELRYRRLFETAQDGMLILDAASGRIVDVNPFMVSMLGYSREEFLDKAIWEIGVLGDIVAHKEKLLELQEKEFVRYDNLPLESADGQRINVEFISNVYMVNGQQVIQCQVRNNAGRR